MSDPETIKREMIYRDSKTFYGMIQAAPRMISEAHVGLCKKYAGKKILDLGCATGDYCLALEALGFECTGADVNKEYVSLAQKKGVKARVVDGKLPFSDKEFDTVVMFEVLEHVQDKEAVLNEAKRVTKKNILISVPDCAGFEDLKKERLAFEHFLELDHTNFFTKDSLEALLSRHFVSFKVMEAGAIRAWLYDTKSFPRNIVSIFLRKMVSLMAAIGFLKPKYYSTLFAVVSIS